MSHGGFDNGFGGPGNNRYNRNRGFRGPFGIFNLVFAMVSLVLTLAFNVVNIVFQIFTGISNSRAEQSRMEHRMPPRQEARQEARQERHEARQEARQQRTKTENIKKEQPINKEQVKQTFKQQKNENTSDWNIVLFVLTLVPLIVALAAKRLDVAGLIAVGGLSIILIYNIIRASVIKAKQHKKQKEEVVIEKNEEDTEIDRIVKDAFDKIYSIRKDLPKIKKPEIEEKLENLCDLSEKIIGEVRSNPESLNSVRKFFYYYLDAFIEVFSKYLKLNNFSETSDEVLKLLSETEKSFDDMQEIFQEMCEGMLEKDMLNLKATINVLKNSNYSNQ